MKPVMQPYRTTADFTELTLPAALRRRHTTKDGVWGVVRVLAGRVKLHFLESGSEVILSPELPGIVSPLEWQLSSALAQCR